MIKKPVNTEKAIRLVEIDNTLVFEVDSKENKESIKNSIEKMFKVKVDSINSLIRLNKKNVYVRLNKKNPAIQTNSLK